METHWLGQHPTDRLSPGCLQGLVVPSCFIKQWIQGSYSHPFLGPPSSEAGQRARRGAPPTRRGRGQEGGEGGGGGARRPEQPPRQDQAWHPAGETGRRAPPFLAGAGGGERRLHRRGSEAAGRGRQPSQRRAGDGGPRSAARPPRALCSRAWGFPGPPSRPPGENPSPLPGAAALPGSAGGRGFPESARRPPSRHWAESAHIWAALPLRQRGKPRRARGGAVPRLRTAARRSGQPAPPGCRAGWAVSRARAALGWKPSSLGDSGDEAARPGCTGWRGRWMPEGTHRGTSRSTSGVRWGGGGGRSTGLLLFPPPTRLGKTKQNKTKRTTEINKEPFFLLK